MHIHRIATRIIDRLDHRPGDVTLDHPYRRHWWLPVIGPTATILLDHLTAIDTHDWQIHDTANLATHLGLGQGSGLHSPLIRTFDRLTRFGFGTFDIEPGHPDADPWISPWVSTPPVTWRSSAVIMVVILRLDSIGTEGHGTRRTRQPRVCGNRLL